jgi:hypothetical protein
MPSGDPLVIGESNIAETLTELQADNNAGATLSVKNATADGLVGRAGGIESHRGNEIVKDLPSKIGVRGHGGDGSAGVVGVGGASGGSGVQGFAGSATERVSFDHLAAQAACGVSGVGAAEDGAGVHGEGGPPDGVGVRGWGTGSGSGVYGTGGGLNGVGVSGDGIGDGAGVEGTGGDAGGTGVVGMGGHPNGFGVWGRDSGDPTSSVGVLGTTFGSAVASSGVAGVGLHGAGVVGTTLCAKTDADPSTRSLPAAVIGTDTFDPIGLPEPVMNAYGPDKRRGNGPGVAGVLLNPDNESPAVLAVGIPIAASQAGGSAVPWVALPGNGFALEVEGAAVFSRSGVTTVPAGSQVTTIPVPVPGGLRVVTDASGNPVPDPNNGGRPKSASHVLANVQNDPDPAKPWPAVRSAVPDPTTGTVTITLTEKVPDGGPDAEIAWLVIG